MFTKSLFASLTVAFACVAPAARALVNGTPAPTFLHVGSVAGASGVQIAPSWVITANHVGGATGSFSNALGTAAYDTKYSFNETPFPNDDIALLHLSSALTSSLAPLFPVLNSTYLTGTDLPLLPALSTLTTAFNPAPQGSVRAPIVDAIATTTDSSGNFRSLNWLVTPGPNLVQGGDSGGGLFLGTPDGSAGAMLLGVASALFSYDPDPNTSYSAFVQVAAYKSWLDGTVGAHSNETLAWGSAIPVPESAPLHLLFAGLFLIGLATKATR